jgi:hypothetical protein
MLQDNTVVIAGSGYLALEVVSAILKWYPGLNIIMLVKGSHIMEGLLNQVTRYSMKRQNMKRWIVLNESNDCTLTEHFERSIAAAHTLHIVAQCIIRCTCEHAIACSHY